MFPLILPSLEDGSERRIELHALGSSFRLSLLAQGTSHLRQVAMLSDPVLKFPWLLSASHLLWLSPNPLPSACRILNESSSDSDHLNLEFSLFKCNLARGKKHQIWSRKPELGLCFCLLRSECSGPAYLAT